MVVVATSYGSDNNGDGVGGNKVGGGDSDTSGWQQSVIIKCEKSIFFK